MEEDYIVHICARRDWEAAKEQGTYHADSLETEGFIHCSRPDQALTVLNRFYRHLTDLHLLWIDPQKVAASIRWEPVEGDEFPHIYGSLNVDAVVAVSALVPNSDGVYRTLPEI